MSNYRTPRDLSGQQFGRLTVLRLDVPWSKGKQSRWLCRCECGNEASVSRGSLTSGNTKSCGCLHREALVSRLTTHGMSGTPIYCIWQKMIARCEDQRCKEYQFYGARGVRVCDRWKSFEAFYEDMGGRPSRRHSIDRIDNDGNYEPGNVRWATYAEQARNTSRNTWLTCGGRTMIAEDWAKELGCDPSVILKRIQRGMSHEEAISAPIQSRRDLRTMTHGDLTLPIIEWASRVGIDYKVLIARANLGWDAGRALATPVRPRKRT